MKKWRIENKNNESPGLNVGTFNQLSFYIYVFEIDRFLGDIKNSKRSCEYSQKIV